jgi:AbiV family abortive infection protein
MNAATKNAGRLAKDAANLLESGSFATAASIAILSIEEAGKVSILRTLALAKSDAKPPRRGRNTDRTRARM